MTSQKRSVLPRDKIESALSTALKHLENSLRILSNNGDETAISDSLWAASAETEYAVFLLALGQEDKTEIYSWKQISSAKQKIDFKLALTTAQELLKKAKAYVDTENLRESHKEAWTARNLLLKAQELVEKKRREAKK